MIIVMLTPEQAKALLKAGQLGASNEFAKAVLGATELDEALSLVRRGLERTAETPVSSWAKDRALSLRRLLVLRDLAERYASNDTDLYIALQQAIEKAGI